MSFSSNVFHLWFAIFLYLLLTVNGSTGLDELINSILAEGGIPSTVHADALSKISSRGAANGPGLTLDKCKSDKFCRSPRVCLDEMDITVSRITPCSPSSLTYRCINIRPLSILCASSNNCTYGERCIAVSAGQTCVSCNAFDLEPEGVTPVDGGNCVAPNTVAPTPSPSPSTLPPGSALGTDECRTRADCKAPRGCIDRAGLLQAETLECNTASLFCVCLDLPILANLCESSVDCDVGERCIVEVDGITQACYSCRYTDVATAANVNIQLVDSGRCNGEEVTGLPSMEPYGTTAELYESPEENLLSETTAIPFPTVPSSPQPSPSAKKKPVAPETSTSSSSATVSPAASQETLPSLVPSPSPSSTAPPCIAVEHLEGLSASQLVFHKHLDATVLCDEAGSCATAGHIVTFRGRAMMMRSYCAIHATCTERRALVNSPHMRRGVRIPAPTTDLQFTAHSARFETRMEEMAIHFLVRLGI